MKTDLLNTIRVADVVPAGQAGVAAVEHFTITEDQAEHENAMMAFRPGSGLDTVAAGRYARLRVFGLMMMSDTPMERRTNWNVVREARGDVLVAGLGIGLILYPIMVKPEVRSITVVEKFQPVIDLVWPHVLRWKNAPGDGYVGGYRRQVKLDVVHADIFDWRPPAGAKWDVLYFDVWPTKSPDNLPQIARLHQKFKGRKRPGGWMDSWYAELLRADRDAERRRWG